MQRFTILALSLLVAGCAEAPTISPEQRAKMEAPICSDARMCELMWQRAQIWLANNSTWKLQTVTPVILQTYGPGGSASSSLDVAYTITKEPLGNDSYRIVMAAACSNMFGCLPKAPFERIIEFNTFLLGTTR